MGQQRDATAALRAGLERLSAGATGRLELELVAALVDGTRALAVLLDRDRRIVWASAAFEALSGATLRELSGRAWPELHPEDDRVAAHHVQWQERALRDDGGCVAGALWIGREIPATPAATAQRNVRRLVENLDDCIYRMELPSGVYSYMSPAAEAVFGHAAQDFVGNPRLIAEIVAEGSRTYFEERWAELVAGHVPPTYLYEVRARDGGARWILQSNAGVFDDEGRLVAIEGICRDVTAARRTQLELHTSHQLLEGSFQVSAVCLAYLDRRFDFVRVNASYARVDGRRPEDFLGKNHFDLYPNAENEAIFARVRDTGVPYSARAKPFEYAHAPERGVTHWDWTLTPVKDSAGHVIGLVLALVDVTARVQAIEALQESERRIAQQLAEKEILLREIHHRVKNNLQVISSLLYFQAAQADDPSVSRLFAASRDRVRAMALVHEILYRSADLGHVDFQPYLTELAVAVQASYAREGVDVEIVCQVDAPPLDIQLAVPCGLLAGELLTNAFKYAFVGRERGRIRLALLARDAGHYCLCVEDDGVGMVEDAAPSPRSLGLRLVRSLTEQLRGELTIGRDAGTSFAVRFPAVPAAAADVSG